MQNSPPFLYGAKMRFLIFRSPDGTEMKIKDEKTVVPVEETDAESKPKNWQYMVNAGKVLANEPDTWKPYPRSIKGACDIVTMEYGELQKAVTKEEKMHEAEHLGAAVLKLWEMLNEQ